MSRGRTVSSWLKILDETPPALTKKLRVIYGPDEDVQAAACALLRGTLKRYLARFGDDIVRIYRAPGRINLRGMHVDTHGGYLNLMTHQREVMVVAGVTDEACATVVNVDEAFAETTLGHDDARGMARDHTDWDAVMRDWRAAALREKLRGSWSLYLWGALIRATLHAGDQPVPGLHCVVGSNLPSGAGLSSSAAFCVALLLAISDACGDALHGDALILAARDAEWFTGARTGTSDQAAVVLGRPNTVVHGALMAEDFSTSGMLYYFFPGHLCVLVVNTHTTRSLSGAQLAAYTANRFSYSMALHALRGELVSQGYSRERADDLDRFSRIQDPDIVDPEALVLALLALPEDISLAAMRDRYAPSNLNTEFDRYFGNVPVADRPERFDLRGPLLYGLSESMRAREIVDALCSGDGATAGRLMLLGHNGDRVVDAEGAPFSRAMSRETEDWLLRNPNRLWEISGNYGASSPVLDGAVDIAIEAGALGASLTGAGLGGSVLVLVDEKTSESVSHTLRRWLASEAYSARAGRTALTEAELDGAIVRNQSPAGAGKF